MKRIILAALIVLGLGTSSFAEAGKASPVTKFEAAFSGSSVVKWTIGEGFKKATFTINEEQVEVFYDMKGELIGTSKKIEFKDLPAAVQKSFAQKFAGYTVKETIDFEGSDKTAYYISAENDKETIIIEVNETLQLAIFKKTQK